MPISSFLYKTLINSELWLADPRSFNDPFDCSVNDVTIWTEDLIRKHLNDSKREFPEDKIDVEAALRAHRHDATIFSKYFNAMLRENIDEIGVLCLTTHPRNLLMWAHYAANHTGVCLGFDITEDRELFEENDRKEKSIFKVDYCNKFPNYNFETDGLKIFNIAILSKSKEWEYEDEYRLLKHHSGNYPFKKECLKEIIFGCRINPKEIETIKKIIKNAEYPNVQCKKAKILEGQYGLDLENF